MFMLLMEIYERILGPLQGQLREAGVRSAVVSACSSRSLELLAALCFWMMLVVHAKAGGQRPMLRCGKVEPEVRVFLAATAALSGLRGILFGWTAAGLILRWCGLDFLLRAFFLSRWLFLVPLRAIMCVAVALVFLGLVAAVLWQALLAADRGWRWSQGMPPRKLDLSRRAAEAAAAGDIDFLARLRDEVRVRGELRARMADEKLKEIVEAQGEGAAEGMMPLIETMREAPPGEGADEWFDAPDPVSGWRPLHEAIVSRQHLAVRWILKQGADANALTDHAKCGFDVLTSSRCSPLLLACQVRDHLIVAELLNAGADPSLQSGHQNHSPAHVAALLGEWEMLDDLKKFKADMHVLDDNGVSPLDLENAHRRTG